MHHKTSLRLPFSGVWLTFWGGDTKDINRHHGIIPQDYAFDFIQVDAKGRWSPNAGLKNEDYYSFGKEILSPASGVVVECCDGIRDNKPGCLNNYNLLGNFVLIKHRQGEFSLLCHLKQGSVAVRAGNKVKKGQRLGECGNSGRSSAPHLHYQLQSADVFMRIGASGKEMPVAKGIKVFFSRINIQRSDENRYESLYSPVKDDIVSSSSSSSRNSST